MAIAIRAITRLQDADDVNAGSLGAGVNQYALTYDHTTGKFLPGDTIRGVALALTGRMTLATTTTADTGVVYKGAVQWLHNYHHATADGGNIFLGLNAGNFTMSPGGGAATLASNNIGMGDTALLALTTGAKNIAVGSGALGALTTGADNVAMGYQALKTATGAAGCTAIGAEALSANTADFGTAVGYHALMANTTGVRNTAIGYLALAANTSGTDAVAIGANTAQANTGGNQIIAIGRYALSANTSGSGSIAIGYTSAFANQTGNNLTAIGNAALRSSAASNGSVALGFSAGYYETAANKLFIDNATRASEADGRIKALIYGEFHANPVSQLLRTNAVFQRLMTDAATSAVTTVDKLSHNSTATPAAGFGTRMLWQLASDTMADQDAAALDVAWSTSTHAARTSYAALNLVNAAGALAQALRVTPTGLSIGVTSPLATVHAVQAGATGARPVLRVEQVDVSEEFMRFIGTSTTDASQSLVDAADMEDPGAITGWLKIYVQDDAATNGIADGAYYVPFYTAPTHSP